MGHSVLIAVKERECAALLRLAGEMVAASERRGSPLSRGEDAMVVELVKKAHLLEREVKRLQLDQRRVIPLKHDEADET
jgi:hypothetical protein